MQLVGHNDPHRFTEDLDLAALAARGVRVTGRLRELNGGVARFQHNLAASVAEAELRMHRFLDAVDAHVTASGLDSEVWAPARPASFVAGAAPATVDLRSERIGTVLLATGYRPDHAWLRVPVTAPDGTIRQHRGVTRSPGLYVVGQRFQHRRDSGFIDGARHDAAAVVDHLTSRRSLDPTPR
jgi:putative flavoprotein involved in K+ transport